MARRHLLHETITRAAIGAFYEDYNTLGFGFLEHIYMAALERELRARGHEVARELWVTVFFKGEPVGKQRPDMVLDELVAVEGKSTFLHFGRERKFYRMISTRSCSHP